MRVNNNNNNKPSFGIADVKLYNASAKFTTKINGMRDKIQALGHSCDVCHLRETGIWEVSAILTVPTYKDLRTEAKGHKIIATIQEAVKKMVPKRQQKGNESLADAAAKWWLAQIQSMEFLGNKRTTDATQISITSMVQRLTPDMSSSYSIALKKLVEKTLAEGKPLELGYFGDSPILAEASQAAGIGNYVAKFSPKMTINDGIIQINAKNTALEELYRLPNELMPE